MVYAKAILFRPHRGSFQRQISGSWQARVRSVFHRVALPRSQVRIFALCNGALADRRIEDMNT